MGLRVKIQELVLVGLGFRVVGSFGARDGGGGLMRYSIGGIWTR